MTTFFLFGKYSQEAIKKISGQRSKEAVALIEGAGGKILSGYAVMGEYDLVLLVQFSSNSQAFKTSVGLAKLLGISFTTAPAVSIEEFDQLVG